MMAEAKMKIELQANAEEIINLLKQEDLVEVVRCKDCKHYASGLSFKCSFWSIYGRIDTKPDDFCSHGVRR